MHLSGWQKKLASVLLCVVGLASTAQPQTTDISGNVYMHSCRAAARDDNRAGADCINFVTGALYGAVSQAAVEGWPDPFCIPAGSNERADCSRGPRLYGSPSGADPYGPTSHRLRGREKNLAL